MGWQSEANHASAWMNLVHISKEWTQLDRLQVQELAPVQTLACDIRIAADNARFAQLEVHAGLFPGFGGAQRLPRLIGHGRATEMIMTGRMVGAEEALTMGLVSRVTPLQDTLTEAVALGQQLATTLDPNALGMYKSRVSLGANETYEEALKNDQIAFDKIAASPEAKTAMERFISRQRKDN
jgi:enoyl-CoA hydratase